MPIVRIFELYLIYSIVLYLQYVQVHGYVTLRRSGQGTVHVNNSLLLIALFFRLNSADFHPNYQTIVEYRLYYVKNYMQKMFFPFKKPASSYC